MSRCITIAKNGLGTTYPNPLVGSVVVYKENIIGEGWHYKAGAPHAEVHAIENATKFIKSNGLTAAEVFKKATIYVSLEPCSHWGKTPPCSHLITKKGIQNVIVGSVDPNPKVAGKGIQFLTENGCKVSQGILEADCNTLNKRFFTFQNKKRPYIFLKWAQTKNGFIAPTSKDTKAPVWISTKISRQLAHKMRAQEQAILVGTSTVLEDNPSLTTRDWAGTNPVRIIIDKQLQIPTTATVLNPEANTLIFNTIKSGNEGHIEYVKIPDEANLPEHICNHLYKSEIQSVIIEGGCITLQHFIDANLWDEAIVFKGTTTFDEGIKAPIFSGEIFQELQLDGDQCLIYLNHQG